MSIVSFTSQKQGVQDLLAALPAPAASAATRSRGDEVSQDAKPGFNDLLRDSSQSREPVQRVDSSDAGDAPVRGEGQQDEQAAVDQPEQVDQDTQSGDASEDVTQDMSDAEDAEQAAEQGDADSSDSQAKDTSEEAQVQAAANAASAQLNVLDAVATDQPKVQAQANASQQIDLAKVTEAASKEQSTAKNQSANANLSLNAALSNQPQTANGPAVQAEVSTTVQLVLQQGNSAQTNSGDTGSDSKSATTANTANATASSNSNAAATTAFAVPDQAGSEARLPINTTSATQAVDAAKQVQAQSAINAGDNDSLNTARLTRGLANAVQQRGGAVTLRLTPPEMGTVRIQMQITGTNVSASFHAESASAQTLLTTQLAQLRTALESKGMSVERLSVQPLAATAQSNNANQSQNQSDTQQQGQSQQQGANDGRSRGQYSGDSSGQQSSDQQDNDSARQAPRGFFDRLNDASEDEAA